MVEPKYPGVVERYVNLGECYGQEGLGPLRDEIMTCMRGYKGCYQRAYRCLSAAAELRRDSRAILLTEQLEERLGKRARGILSREVRRKPGVGDGQVKQRFLNAVTHKGELCLYHTVQSQCQRVYEISDRWGLAHALLTHLLSGTVRSGYDLIACPDPMFPERLAHVLVPELSLAFVTSRPERPWPECPYRRIKPESMTEEGLLRANRTRLKFAHKVSAALMAEGVDSLAQAKAMHDDLEGLYNPHVDFNRVEEMAGAILREIELL